ncbi:hypothetical protein ACA910_009353 [Epithemia clementina (nom. ined.)]
MTTPSTSTTDHNSILYFTFRGTQKVPVTFGSHITLEQAQMAMQSEPFQTWCRRCERRVALWPDDDDDNDFDDKGKNASDTTATKRKKKKPRQCQELQVHSVELQSIDMFGPRRVGFVKIKSHVTLTTLEEEAKDNSFDNQDAVVWKEIHREHDDKALPGICLLRGSAVTILVALFCQEDNQAYSLLVEQPRVPIGQVACLELPAGMVDDETVTVSGIALQELQEECGIPIDPRSDHLIDLTALAFGHADDDDDKDDEPTFASPDAKSTTSRTTTAMFHQPLWHLPSAAIPPSPGGCDEVLRLFYLEKNVTLQELHDMKGRLHGLREHGEYITLRVVPMDQVWKVSGDAKAIIALFLLDQLRKEGKLPEAGRLATPLSTNKGKNANN